MHPRLETAGTAECSGNGAVRRDLHPGRDAASASRGARRVTSVGLCLKVEARTVGEAMVPDDAARVVDDQPVTAGAERDEAGRRRGPLGGVGREVGRQRPRCERQHPAECHTTAVERDQPCRVRGRRLEPEDGRDDGVGARSKCGRRAVQRRGHPESHQHAVRVMHVCGHERAQHVRRVCSNRAS